MPTCASLTTSTPTPSVLVCTQRGGGHTGPQFNRQLMCGTGTPTARQRSSNVLPSVTFLNGGGGSTPVGLTVTRECERTLHTPTASGFITAVLTVVLTIAMIAAWHTLLLRTTLELRLTTSLARSRRLRHAAYRTGANEHPPHTASHRSYRRNRRHYRTPTSSARTCRCGRQTRSVHICPIHCRHLNLLTG